MKTAFYSFVFAVFPKIAKGKARGFLLKEGGVPGTAGASTRGRCEVAEG